MKMRSIRDICRGNISCVVGLGGTIKGAKDIKDEPWLEEVGEGG
jgi:hypothetical protein